MIKNPQHGAETVTPGRGLPWWKGPHGEWYLAAQLVLMALVFFGPRTLPGLPDWPMTLTQSLRVVGIALLAGGSGLLLAGLLQLGSRSLSPLPSPRQHAKLIQSGPYRLVRHPMYAGGIMLAYGWALAVHGWLTLVYATILAVFLDIKSSREERWLVEKFPDYPDYQRRVSKLIPFVY